MSGGRGSRPAVPPGSGAGRCSRVSHASDAAGRSVCVRSVVASMCHVLLLRVTVLVALLVPAYFGRGGGSAYAAGPCCVLNVLLIYASSLFFVGFMCRILWLCVSLGIPKKSGSPSQPLTEERKSCRSRSLSVFLSVCFSVCVYACTPC